MRTRFSLFAVALLLGVLCAGASFAAELDDGSVEVELTATDAVTASIAIASPVASQTPIVRRACVDTGCELAGAIFRPPIFER